VIISDETRAAAALTRRTAFLGAAYLASAALFCQYVLGHPASRRVAVVVLLTWAEAFLIRGFTSLAILSASTPRRALWLAAAGLAIASTFLIAGWLWSAPPA